MAKVAFLGLGVMGFPMAGHLVKKGGHDLRAVTLGDNGAFAGMKKGATFVDHTTASAEIARELDAEATKRGFKFVDAPVSGGQAGAENGVLTVMCGGSEEAYAGAEPVIAAYARMCKRLGPAGSGQLTKMVNQICIAGLVEGLSEGIHFAKKSAQGPLDLPRRSPAQWREPSGHRAGRCVLFGSREDGRQALGHFQPARPAGALSIPGRHKRLN